MQVIMLLHLHDRGICFRVVEMHGSFLYLYKMSKTSLGNIKVGLMTSTQNQGHGCTYHNFTIKSKRHIESFAQSNKH